MGIEKRSFLAKAYISNTISFLQQLTANVWIKIPEQKTVKNMTRQVASKKYTFTYLVKNSQIAQELDITSTY